MLRPALTAGLIFLALAAPAAADGDPHLIEPVGSRSQVKYGQGHPRGATGRLPARWPCCDKRYSTSNACGRIPRRVCRSG